MIRWYRACSIAALTDRRRRLRGQISTFLILVMVVILIFTFAVVNLGKVSAMSTTVANAADTAALDLGSQLATKAMFYRETFSHTHGGRHKDGNTGICIASGWLLEALPYILAVVAMANPGIGSVLGKGVLAAANAGAIGGALSGVIKYGNLKGAVIGAAMGFAAGASVGYAWQSFGLSQGATEGAKQGAKEAAEQAAKKGLEGGAKEAFKEALSPLTLAPGTAGAGAGLAGGTAVGSSLTLTMPAMGMGGAGVGVTGGAGAGVAQAGAAAGKPLELLMPKAFTEAGLLPAALPHLNVAMAATGAFLSSASGTYNGVVQQKLQINAINAAMKSLNSLSEEDRIKESVIFNALSLAVDDPTMVPDTNDFNGDGNTTDEIPKFVTWWDVNTQRWRASGSIDELIKNYLKNGKTPEERGPVATLRLALRQAVHSVKDDHRHGGVLAIDGIDGVSGLLERLDLEGRDDKEHKKHNYFPFRNTKDNGTSNNHQSYELNFWDPNGPTTDGMNKWRACQQKLDDELEKHREDNEDDDPNPNEEEPPITKEPLDPLDVDPCGRPERWDEVDETNVEFKGFIQLAKLLIDKTQLKRLTETWEDWLPYVFYEPMGRRPPKPNETDADKTERERVAQEEQANPQLLLERDPLMRLVAGFDMQVTNPKDNQRGTAKFAGIKSWRTEMTQIVNAQLPICRNTKPFNPNKLVVNWPCRVSGTNDPQATSDPQLVHDNQYVTDSKNQKKPGLINGKCGTLDDLKGDPAPEDKDVCEGEFLRADAALAKLQDAIEAFHKDTDELMKELRAYQAQLEIDYATCKDPKVPSTCKAQKPPSTLTYDWTDSRGAHSVTATVGPFTVPWIQGYTKEHCGKNNECLGLVLGPITRLFGSAWSSKCWRIRGYKSTGKNTWVKVSRKDPAEQKAGPWWVWNPHKGETIKVAHVKYNARPAYYVRGWEKSRDDLKRRDAELPRVALTDPP